MEKDLDLDLTKSTIGKAELYSSYNVKNSYENELYNQISMNPNPQYITNNFKTENNKLKRRKNLQNISNPHKEKTIILSNVNEKLIDKMNRHTFYIKDKQNLINKINLTEQKEIKEKVLEKEDEKEKSKKKSIKDKFLQKMGIDLEKVNKQRR